MGKVVFVTMVHFTVFFTEGPSLVCAKTANRKTGKNRKNPGSGKFLLDASRTRQISNSQPLFSLPIISPSVALNVWLQIFAAG